MLKKLTFILLVFSFVIAGALVSMATEDEDSSINNEGIDNTAVNSVVPVVEAIDVEQQEEEYSHEAVIEIYSSLFFDADSETENTLIKDIEINKDNNKSDNKKAYALSASLADEVQLEDGDTIVVMAFVKNGDSFELLGEPKECNVWCLERITFELPFTGKENPNLIRVLAFPKKSYSELSINNIQIYDEEVIIEEKGFIFKDSLKPWQDAFEQLKIIIPK